MSGGCDVAISLFCASYVGCPCGLSCEGCYIGIRRALVPRNAILWIPPGPEGSNGSRLVCVQRSTGAWLFLGLWAISS